MFGFDWIDSKLKGTLQAILAGVWAAIASTALKMTVATIPEILDENRQQLIACGLSLCAFVFANMMMWISFTAALDRYSTAYIPAVINFTSNAITSTIVGSVFLNESLAWQTLVGNAAMVTGALFLLAS
eukprot:gene1933-5022_t